MKYAALLILLAPLPARAEFQVYASTPTSVTRAMLLERYNNLARKANSLQEGNITTQNWLMEDRVTMDFQDAYNKGILDALDSLHILPTMPVIDIPSRSYTNQMSTGTR